MIKGLLELSRTVYSVTNRYALVIVLVTEGI
jgi:hypothetical protein